METPTYPGPASLEAQPAYHEVPVHYQHLSLLGLEQQVLAPVSLINTEPQAPSFVDEVLFESQNQQQQRQQEVSEAGGVHKFVRPAGTFCQQVQLLYLSGSCSQADTVVMCRDGSRRVHSVMLAAASPLLCSLLPPLEPEHEQLVVLPDYSVGELDQAIGSMYGFHQEDIHSDIGRFLFGGKPQQPEGSRRRHWKRDSCGAADAAAALVKNELKTYELDDSVRGCLAESVADSPLSDDEGDGRRQGSETAALDGGPSDVLLSEGKNIDDLVPPGRPKDGRYVAKQEAELLAVSHYVRTEDTKDFKCVVCEGRYKTKCINAMRTHVYGHLKIFIYKCDKCSELFRQLANYYRHLKRHKRLELKGAKNNSSLGNYHKLEEFITVDPEDAKPIVESYMKYLPGKREHSCKLCKYSNKIKKEVYVHCLSKHLKIWLYRCVQCSKGFKQKSIYLKHMRNEHQLDVMQQRQEAEMMTQAEKLAQATDVDADDITRVDREALNGKLISYRQGLKLAESLVSKCPDDGSYFCKECGKRFAKIIGNLREHIWRTHYNVYMYRCTAEGCDRKLRKLTEYKDHVKQHEVKEIKKQQLLASHENALMNDANYHLLTSPMDVNKTRGFEIAGLYFFHDPTISLYKCKLCQFTHNRIQGTRNHVLANHLTQVFLYRCGYCGKRYRYETQFKLHMAIHEEGKFVCSQCGKQLITKRYLEQHEKTAHGNQSFNCTAPDCQYKGKTEAQMERHRKVYHSTDQSDWHFCEICAKPFPYLNDLKVHLGRCLEGKSMAFKKQRFTKYFTRHGEESFLCLVCNNQCKSHRSIIEHIKKAHNIMEGAVKYLKCQTVGCKFKTIKEDKLAKHALEAGHH